MKILVINSSTFTGGAEESLIEFLDTDNNFFEFVIIVPKEYKIKLPRLNKTKHITLPLIWFSKSFNPIYYLKCFINLIYVELKLNEVIRNEKIDIVYSNTIKNHIYGLIIKLLTGKKVVWHVRDNIQNGILKSIMVKYSDKIVCISNHIYSQINICSKATVIYNGIDTLKFSPDIEVKHDIRELLTLPSGTLLVAQVGQITRWKNHIDFIRCAWIVLNNQSNVHFLIVGDDLSGREKKYLTQIKNEIFLFWFE